MNGRMKETWYAGLGFLAGAGLFILGALIPGQHILSGIFMVVGFLIIAATAFLFGTGL